MDEESLVEKDDKVNVAKSLRSVAQTMAQQMSMLALLQKQVTDVNSAVDALNRQVEDKLSELSTTVADQVKAHFQPQLDLLKSMVDGISTKIAEVEVDMENWLINLENELDKLLERSEGEAFSLDTSVIIFGVKHEPNKDLLIALLKSCGLRQQIECPTHITEHSSSLLEYVICNREDMYYFIRLLFSFAGITPITLSDHHLVYAIRKRLKVKNNNINIRARSYKNINENHFVQDLNEYDWAGCLEAVDVNVAWCSFRDDFISITDRHAPFKYKRFSSNLPTRMTRECLGEIRLREIKDAKHAKTGSIFDLAIARRQRNIVTNMKRNLKKLYYTNSIQEAQGNTKKLWKLLKTLFRNCDANSRIQDIDGESDSLTVSYIWKI